MIESATAAARRQTAATITRCAQDLTDERGLDGFTMDDLAARAGVSRRTLFNYVGGKLDAVLGAPAAPDPSRLEEFRSGGPTGRLGDDVKTVITGVLDGTAIAPDGLERMRRLIASDARLHRAMHDKFALVSDFFTEAILVRKGAEFDPLHARAAATVTLGLFDVALDAFVADPGTSMVDHYMAAFDGAAALFC